jgi:hypothetical protein
LPAIFRDTILFSGQQPRPIGLKAHFCPAEQHDDPQTRPLGQHFPFLQVSPFLQQTRPHRWRPAGQGATHWPFLHCWPGGQHDAQQGVWPSPKSSLQLGMHSPLQQPIEAGAEQQFSMATPFSSFFPVGQSVPGEGHRSSHVGAAGVPPQTYR